MHHRTYRLMSIIVAAALTLGSFISASAKGGTQAPSLALGRIYFVSTSGSDSNAGTSSAPFKTFIKAISMLTAGDELQIYGGTYTQQLNVNKSGTSSAPISIKAVPGQQVIIDGGGTNDELVLAPAGTSYVNLSGITCKNASIACVVLRGTHIQVSNFDVSGSKKFGVRVTGSYITVQNSSIHDNVTENLNGVNTTSGWGSALRSAQETGSNNTFRNNQVFHNWGEGIIMGSSNSQVYGNSVHDNYSKNIYIGNTFSVDVYQNVTYSTESQWFRSGNPADCISMSEELISSTWGAKLGNIRVFNNIASNCKSGMGYTYAEVTGNGCNNCLIAFNTITASKNVCIKVIDGSKNNIEIADNICSTSSISVPSGGVSVHNNFTGDAKLTGGAIGDPNSYRPLSGSPVIGAGVNVGISTDYFGVSRSPYDIGSIQAGLSSQGSIPTATVVPPSPTPIVPTATQILPTATLLSTATPVVILPSPTPILPTATQSLPTPTRVSPTPTQIILTATSTVAPPSPTPILPTATQILPTSTRVSPRSTRTIPTATSTVVPPSSTPILPTATAIVPTATSTAAPSPTSQPPSVGTQTYDDKNSIFVYSGTWEDTTVSGAYDGSFKKSMVPGQSVTMTFTGRSFSIIYTKNSTFTTMNVFVDNTQVGTIDEYASSRQLQKIWDLPLTLASGTHTLKLVHAGADTTTRIAVDAVTVYP